ncbi:hypothetical protein NT6N_31330 [Oceaniferula spumae]|uniref:DUF721 domain-containing protein n=1 Tax=Oceaniferula spumae TaxID=2979115 RepID=A0AAT9FQ36_9BACT
MMGENKPRSRKGRPRNKGSDRIRAKLLTEWRGGIDPPNPARNIHQPDEFLDDLLKIVGLSDGVDEERLKEAWGTVAGEFVSKHTVPESIRDGVLVLRVVQPAMKFHLQQMSSQLLQNLHRELGKDTVKKIVFKIG